ncbi:MAG: pilin [Candidatus Paceibacterota bacterium]
MKKKLMSLGLIVSSVFMFATFLAPQLASAQATGCFAIPDPNAFNVLLCRIATILNNVIPVLITLAVIYFIWGVIHYAIARDEDAKTEGRGAMINGLIALMVIVSVWGLVNFIKNFVGLDVADTEISIPCIESPGVDCPQ